MAGAHVRSSLPALLVLVLVLVAMAAKSLLISVPPVRAQAGTSQFDTARAFARLERILGDERPHPTDTVSNDAVRARLIAELSAIGLPPVVRQQTACNSFKGAAVVTCARVQNVVAQIGPTGGKALLLNAHYDGTWAGPAASDDGIGVATLLEVAAILKDRPLRRPIIFLFNEGEELGLLGARAFLADPLSRNVDALLNFEARGVTGPVTMFETSRPNAAAVAVFADAVDRPFASSLATDVYELLPNDTDVSVFKDRGWLALNFAMVGNETRYHSPGDTLAALDRRTLQHMGDQALATATRLADGTPQAGGTRIFVDVLGRFLVQMPLIVGLMIFAVALAGSAVLAVRRGRAVRTVAAVALAILAASALAWLASWIMSALRPGTYWRAYPELTQLAVYATATFGALLSLRTIGARASREQMRAGYWLTFLLVGAGLATVAPGAIIYFLFPPLLMLAGVLASRWTRHGETGGTLLALTTLYLTWGEMLALLEQLFSPGPQWIVAPIGATIIIPLLIEAEPLLSRAGKRALLIGSAVLAVVAWIVAATAPAYSEDRQQMFSIEHVTDAKAGRAYWSVLNDGAPLPEQFGGVEEWKLLELPHSKRKRWAASAPRIAVEPAAVDLVSRDQKRSQRTIRLRLRTNGAAVVSLRAPKDSGIAAAGIGTSLRQVDGSKGDFALNCSGRSCDGAVATLVLTQAKPLVLIVVGVRPGLPPQGDALLGDRPRFARPQYGTDQTVTVDRVRI